MIIDDLITNRTQEDASYAAELAAKGQDMTTEEWAAYLAGLRGAYNYTDLNRVTEAMEYINDRLSGYGYTSGYKSIEISREQEPSGRLPKGYTELEYLESSGTQYIDTGVQCESGYTSGYGLHTAVKHHQCGCVFWSKK